MNDDDEHWAVPVMSKQNRHKVAETHIIIFKRSKLRINRAANQESINACVMHVLPNNDAFPLTVLVRRLMINNEEGRYHDEARYSSDSRDHQNGQEKLWADLINEGLIALIQ